MSDWRPPTELMPRDPSDPWPARRRQYQESHPKRCAICAIPDCDLHHRRYSKRGQEPDRDLEWLCKVHHRTVHRWHDRLAPKDVRPYRWLSMVTTLAIVVLRAHLRARRPMVVMVLTTAAYWWVGLWLPLVALGVMALAQLWKGKTA